MWRTRAAGEELERKARAAEEAMARRARAFEDKLRAFEEEVERLRQVERSAAAARSAER